MQLVALTTFDTIEKSIKLGIGCFTDSIEVHGIKID